MTTEATFQTKLRGTGAIGSFSGFETKEPEVAFPLSPTQEGILFHSLLAPNAGLYIEQIVLSLDGEIDARGKNAHYCILLSIKNKRAL